MNKLIQFGLVALFVIGLCGCGDGGKPVDHSSETPSQKAERKDKAGD